MNVSEAIRLASSILEENDIPFASRESASLLCFVLDVNRTYLIAHSEDKLTEQERHLYLDAVRRRALREPFQYIVGKQEFYGLEFEVSRDVLIPRPETEVLVTEAIQRIRGPEPFQILEIGVGSGCITVSLLIHVSTARALAIDISEGAIKVAARNAARHGVDSRVEFRTGDLYSPVGTDVFDAILSNPPYVPARDLPGLQPEVRDHEPHIALTDGGSGIELIERIIRGGPKHLRAGGFLALEVGFNQARAIIGKFDRSIWERVEVIPDLRGIDRVIIAYLR